MGKYGRMDVVEMEIDSIRRSMTPDFSGAVVLLQGKQKKEYLPIFIGPYECDRLVIELQNMERHRPLTDDLYMTVLRGFHIKPVHVVIHSLVSDIFLATMVVRRGWINKSFDCRPSDALILSVYFKVPIYVNVEVISKAGIVPSLEINLPPKDNTTEG